MRTILDDIVENRRGEVIRQRQLVSQTELTAKTDFNIPRLSLAQRLIATGSSGIIAEFKRISPSKGVINDRVEPQVVTKGYAEAGAAGISVLTDSRYFGGSTADFNAARSVNPNTPMIRKDFMVDEYQIHEARFMQADVILLIAAVLDKSEIAQYTSVAHELGLEVLLELHDESELEKIDPRVDMIGINNRNLKDFKVDMEQSLRLFDQLPTTAIKISESGLSDPKTVDFLRNHGFQGFLMGENFMKMENPAAACADFISSLKI